MYQHSSLQEKHFVQAFGDGTKKEMLREEEKTIESREERIHTRTLYLQDI